MYQGLVLVGSSVQAGPVLRLLQISVHLANTSVRQLDIAVHLDISLQEPVGLIETSRVISLIDSTVIVTVSTIAYNNYNNQLITMKQ